METKTSNLTLAQEKANAYGLVDGLSLQNLYYAENSSFPNCYMFTQSSRDNNNYFKTREFYDYILANVPEGEEIKHIEYVTYSISNKKESFGCCIWMKKANLFARIEDSISESYILYSNENRKELKDLVETLMRFYAEPEVEDNNIYTISHSSFGYSLIKSSVKTVEDFDVMKQYNDDFQRENEKIEKFIEKEDKSGLIILHGEKGTGKTTYIRHLINKYPKRKFVFVPATMIQLLGDVSFSSFLLTLANHVIILEDCENAIRDRKVSGSAASVSLLLNMTDGLLSDDLGIKFICTFNEDVRNIDEALMRKGRLVSKYEFKPLCIEKTKTLIEELFGKNSVDNVSKALTLADIYNFEDDSYEKQTKSII